MSETLSRDPETQSSGYALAPNYPATSSSDQSGSNLPPFSTFAVEMDASTGFNFTESRIMEIPHWDYYHETRLVDRIENGIIVSQAQYRPWESKDAHPTFADAFAAQNGISKLPSFQSQFQAFNDPVTTSEQPTLTTLTPVSPSVSSPNITTLGPVSANFHTLNARNYPLVPAPIQAREIPSIQQQFLDERHIQLYTHPTQFPPQNGTIIQNISAPTVVHVVKTEPDFKLTLHPDQNLKLQNITLHPTQFQNPMSTIIDHSGGIYNGLDKKINGINVSNISSPTRSDFRKKERRKIRASSLESSAESDGASSNMEIGNENSGQVAAVSSTAGYKHHSMSMNSMDVDDMNGSLTDKQVKKKRKRCGECIGCQRKDNCGDCAPCRNDKSHQICKQRRCEKLTEKKNLYGDPALMRGESRRGRGKGRGGGSYRGRKAAAAAAISNNAASEQPPPAPVSRPSPQPAAHMIKQEPVHMIKQEPVHMVKQEPVQQQTMAPVPFYTDPNRFSTPVWQADPTIAPQEVVPNWPQGQFIQQIAPAQPQTTLDAYPPQQYPNGIYQTTYQQPTFESNTFYTGAVQVLSTRPPSVPSQQLTPRTNGSYTPSPSPVTQNQSQQQQPQQSQQQPQASQPPPQNNGQRTNINAYEYMQNYAPPATPPVDNQQAINSRPNSVNGNAPTPNQTYSQTANSFTSVSSTNFSPSSNSAPHYVNANSGNEQPGYPQVNSNPPLISHNSSGYPGQFGGNNNQTTPEHQQVQQVQIQQQWTNNDNAHMMWQQSPAQPAQHAVNQQQQQSQDQMNESAKQSDNNTTNQYENENNHHDPGDQFNQAHRVNLNSRIKSMILNKQQDKKMEDVQKDEHNKQTGHFLWYSHHRRLDDIDSDGGGFSSIIRQNPRFQQFNHDKFYNANLNYNHNQFNYFQSSLLPNQFKNESEVKIEGNFNVNHAATTSAGTTSEALQVLNTGKPENGVGSAQEENKVKTNLGNEIPQCNCFPTGNSPPEPGTYYTHLGCSSNLANLRKDLELRTGVTGKAIRIEKIKYTGKEGKSAQGCPIAKWIIRRSDYQEKYLIIVKHRQGHFCFSAFIVVCIVAWEGIRQKEADELYSILTEKLNKFGIPTTRRCGTNEQRNCACQGIHPDTSGASYSFGCSWSMYYNGCKFARSKCVRKFRLSSQNEEKFMEEKLQAVATCLVPLYKSLAPIAFNNQCANEMTDMECRLGEKLTGRPFSGVTACLDFCSHSHKDTHNMNDGCTVVVSLTKERVLGKPKQDEQLHVLPLYTVDATDEFGAVQKNNQSIEVLKSYKCEVRMRTVPLQSCRRSKKKKPVPGEDGDITSPKKRSSSKETPIKTGATKSKSTNAELQNNQITSTVNNNKQLALPSVPTTPSPSTSTSLDRYHRHDTPVLDNWNNPRTAFNVTYPVMTPYSYTPTQYNLPPPMQNAAANMQYAANGMMHHHHYAVNQKVQDSNSGSTSTSNHQLVIDYDQHRMPMQPFHTPYYHPPRHLNDYNCSYPVGFNPPSPYDYHQRSVLPTLPSLNWSHHAPPPSFPAVNHVNHGMLSSLSSFQMHPTSSQLSGLSGLTVPPAIMPAQSVSEVEVIPPKAAIGTIKEISENLDAFKDSTIGGVAIALSHGSVLFECAKYEFHATTALKCPNRLNPTRISLVFYQHRNLNKPKHGWDAYEEKMRLRKMGVSVSPVVVSNSIDVSTSLDTTTTIPETPSAMLHPLSSMTSFHTYVPLQPMQMPTLYQSTFGI